MHIVRAFFMALGMFTAIPCPYRPWEEESRGIMLACLPIVGALIGLIWTLIAVSAKALLPAPLGAAFIAAQPYVLTGICIWTALWMCLTRSCPGARSRSGWRY